MSRIVARTMAIAALLISAWASSRCDAQNAAGTAVHWTWGMLPEQAEMSAVSVPAGNAYSTRDFAKLDAFEMAYRDSGAMTTSGISKLYLFYYALAYEVEKPVFATGCDAADDGTLERWRAASPKSPVPIILAVKLLNARAWCHRGEGHTDSVAQGSWQPFNENINAAADLLEKNKIVASADPEYYALLEDLYKAQGRSRTEFDRLLAEGSDRFPLYYEIYNSAVQYYQPQWFGSDGDIDRIARYAVEKTRSRDGTTGYFRVYWGLVRCKCYQDAALADWATMRTALADLARNFPVDASYIKAAQFACMRGEAGDAKKYLSMLTVNDPAFWDAMQLGQCRALVGPDVLPIPIRSQASP